MALVDISDLTASARQNAFDIDNYSRTGALQESGYNVGVITDQIDFTNGTYLKDKFYMLTPFPKGAINSILKFSITKVLAFNAAVALDLYAFPAGKDTEIAGVKLLMTNAQILPQTVGTATYETHSPFGTVHLKKADGTVVVSIVQKIPGRIGTSYTVTITNDNDADLSASFVDHSLIINVKNNSTATEVTNLINTGNASKDEFSAYVLAGQTASVVAALGETSFSSDIIPDNEKYCLALQIGAADATQGILSFKYQVAMNK